MDVLAGSEGNRWKQQVGAKEIMNDETRSQDQCSEEEVSNKWMIISEAEVKWQWNETVATGCYMLK
jgi:hypothetical protein